MKDGKDVSEIQAKVKEIGNSISELELIENELKRKVNALDEMQYAQFLRDRVATETHPGSTPLPHRQTPPLQEPFLQ